MRHCSVQVRGLLTRDELDRYNALMEVGSYLETQKRYDLVATVQAEVDLLIQPGIERLKEKGRARDRMTQEYLEEKRRAEWEAQMSALEEDDLSNGRIGPLSAEAGAVAIRFLHFGGYACLCFSVQ